MKKPIAVLLGVALALLAAASLRAEQRVRAGNYEIIRTFTSPGTPDMTRTTTHCSDTAEVAPLNGDAASLQAAAEAAAAKAKYTIEDYKLQGNIESYTLVGSGSSTASTTTFHSGDSYEILLTTTNKAGKSTILVKGRRLGDCP